MKDNALMVELTRFFRTATHLWGRCPRCGELFRLSEAAISFGDTPPRDWLLRFQKQQELLAAKRGELDDWQAELETQEHEVRDREREIERGQRNLEGTARALAKDMLKSDKTIKALMKEARQQAILRSRSTLLGKLFERLGPFLQRFGHDPRDVRPILDPIDYVVFDGLTVNRRVKRITFVEVKSGTARESDAQKSIAQAIHEGRLGFETWQFGKRGIPLEQQLLKPEPMRPALPPGGQKES
jgi:predicted Holliday junction resolvase-like endonuclease